MNAQYTGAAREPDGLFCLTGLTNGQPGAASITPCRMRS